MGTLPEFAWSKSSHGSGARGECVEVAACPGAVHVRDSKDTAGPVLSVASGGSATFVGFAAQG
ncbi:DUF397 domain-containing protein [Streptomyces sp. NPDC088246]|uniref:DUF397 domain-containing protein n=1 Tax=Streptomyces sp. NPDC088246 TaxID=3365842 RepID=UPI0037FCE1D1